MRPARFFSNPLNLHQNPKAKPPSGIVECTFLIIKTILICTSHRSAIFMVVCFNVSWRTIMDYEFNPLFLTAISYVIVADKSFNVAIDLAKSRRMFSWFGLSILTWMMHFIRLFRSPCKMQDNFFYLTVSNKYMIRIRQKGKVEVFNTTHNFNRKYNVLLIGNLMKNDELFHLQGLHNFVFGFLVAFVVTSTNKRGPF